MGSIEIVRLIPFSFEFDCLVVVVAIVVVLEYQQ